MFEFVRSNKEQGRSDRFFYLVFVVRSLIAIVFNRMMYRYYLLIYYLLNICDCLEVYMFILWVEC